MLQAFAVFHHVYGYFLRHRFYAGPYANDFASWAAVQLRDRVLGERLAVLDPFEFADLDLLREELMSIIDDHLTHLPVVPRLVYGEPFYFVQSHIVEIATGQRARTRAEFRQHLGEIDASTVYYHMVEARVRRCNTASIATSGTTDANSAIDSASSPTSA